MGLGYLPAFAKKLYGIGIGKYTIHRCYEIITMVVFHRDPYVMFF